MRGARRDPRQRRQRGKPSSSGVVLRGPEPRGSLRLSKLVPGLDFDLLATFLRRDDQHQAVREFRDCIREAAGQV
jgi:hypothetical protein